MKKVLFIFSLIGMGLVFMNFTSSSIKAANETPVSKVEIPDNVQKILDNSCMGCHNSDSKNTKGKNKLNFDKLDALKTYKAIGKYTDIAEVVTEGDMPPKKFLNKYPERALSDDDKAVLSGWASDQAKALSGGE